MVVHDAFSNRFNVYNCFPFMENEFSRPELNPAFHTMKPYCILLLLFFQCIFNFLFRIISIFIYLVIYFSKTRNQIKHKRLRLRERRNKKDNGNRCKLFVNINKFLPLSQQIKVIFTLNIALSLARKEEYI